MAGGHHHRSGPLKQANKKHKTGKHATKTTLTKLQGGKIDKVKTASAASSHSMQASNKAMRVLKQKQTREKKRDDLLLQRRFGSGSSLGPPKTIALIALGELANLGEIKASILEGASQIEEPVAHALRNCTVGVFAQHKQKVCIIECGNDVLVAMDAAKVADIIVYVLPVHQGIDSALNVSGARIISAIRAQGQPATIGCIQGLDLCTGKAQADLKKLGQRFFETEFGEAVKVAVHNLNNQLPRTVMTMALKTIHWREARSYMLATVSNFVPHSVDNPMLGTLQLSGYIRGKPLSVNQLIHITDVGTFQLSHITQGQTKSTDVVQKMDMNDEEAVAVGEPVVLAQADPTVQEDLRMEAEYDPFAAEQTWPTKEELAEAEREKRKSEKTMAKNGMSSYQSAWLSDGDDEEKEDGDDDAMDEDEQEGDNDDDDDDDEEEQEHDAVDQSFCQTKSVKSMGENEDDDDDDMSMDDEDDATRERNMAALKEKRREEDENDQFPDEVDAPVDMAARIRFARFRGLKSMRTSLWDPKESLPMDYARLFQFEDFAQVQRLALKRGKDAEQVMLKELRRKQSMARSRATSIASSAMVDEGMETQNVDSLPSVLPQFNESSYIASGVFVTLHLKNVPLEPIQRRVQAGPLILGALLKHENRMSMLNFSVQRAASFTEPLKSKEPVVFHCGFRRYGGKPVYSDQSLKSDQHLFQRFFPQTGWAVASVYAPVTYQPASVLMFRDNLDLELLATGTLMNVNPDRVVLKRVVLTGTPVKTKKRKAVVRYMFHQPEDVRWFKPVELYTKHGMTGHIKESLGTHGDFKAVFNKPVKQHDTICLPLYKRVYPKFVE